MKKDANKTPLRVALYLRVSTEEQVEKYGHDLQKTSLMALISSKPNDLVFAGEKYIYKDDISGTTDLYERPSFSRLIEDIVNSPVGERPFDAVAVYKIDRFARKLKILLSAIDFFEEQGLQFLSANESIDTSTPFGKAMLGIVGVIAELEIETIKGRMIGGRAEAFDQGIVLGANPPYGYKKDLLTRKYEIAKDEKVIVENIFNMFVVENKSVDSIAKYLTSHNVISPEMSAIKNKKRKGGAKKKSESYFWRSNKVRQILQDQIYIGKIYGNKTKNNKLLPQSEWKLSETPAPSIIDEVTFEKAQRLLSENKHQRKTAINDHVYLLSGLLKCDCCFNQKNDLDRIRWSGERKSLTNKVQYYYKCQRKNKSKTLTICQSLPLNANEVENYFIEYVKKLIKNPIAVFNHQKDLKSKQNTINHLRVKENQLIKLIGAIPVKKVHLKEQNIDGLIGRAELNKKIEVLEEDRKRYQTEFEEIKQQISLNSLSKGYIEAFDVFAQKYKEMLINKSNDRQLLYTIFHSLIEEVIVYSRPLNKKDIIAGKRKEDQQIPYRFHIKLKLPQDILAQIANQENTPVRGEKPFLVRDEGLEPPTFSV